MQGQTEQVAQPITDLVRQHLDGAGLRSYARQAEPIITALIQREQNLARAIIEYAGQAGLPQGEAVSALQGLGMHVAGVQPVQTMTGTVASAVEQNQAGDLDVAAALARINTQLDRLTEFARANGYRD